MADEIDLANEIAERHTSEALRAALSAATGPRRPVNATGRCRSCKEEIESERLLGDPTADLCGFCAAEAEEIAAKRRRTGR